MAPRLPDDKQIVELLKQLKFRPSDRFYRRMSTAPWIKEKSSHSFFKRRYLAFGGAALLVVMVVVLAMPSLQVVAKQIINFFLPSASDHRTLSIVIPYPGGIQDVNSPDYCPLTIAQAEEEVGYVLQQISQFPQGFVLSGAHVDPTMQSVTMCFAAMEQKILFTQRKLGKIQEYSSIGASASVEKVWVRGVEGEYVTGGWRMMNNKSGSITTATPGAQVTLAIYWDAGLPQQMLRWVEGDTFFEIIYQGNSEFNQKDLLELAENIQKE